MITNIGLPDIYFKTQYAQLYQSKSNETVETMVFKNENGEIYFQYIKRNLTQYETLEHYSDIITPYGYSGPIITRFKQNKKQQLVGAFKTYLENYCLENKIVCCFVRFHPLLKNYADFSQCFTIEFNRKTVATNLKDYGDPLENELDHKTKKQLRYAERFCLNIRWDQNSQTLENFYDLYTHSMQRKNAQKYFFFTREYFEKMKQTLKNSMIIINVEVEQEIVASALCLYSDNFAHMHLCCAKEEWIKKRVNYKLYQGVIEWAKQNNMHFLHYGGGLTTCEKDTLYHFKKRFATHSNFDFYVGKKIYFPEIYEKAVEIKNKNEHENDENFFPQYRTMKTSNLRYC